MGRYTGPSCRLCRREGTKLFLKGTRCLTEKCAIERREYAPGQHGQGGRRRRKSSDYARQLREKQKVKRIYGVSEKQFRNTFTQVLRQPGVTGENLLIALESRLDNVVYRLGFAPSRKAARQLVRHRHVEVNGSKIDIPAHRLRPGDEVHLTAKGRDLVQVQEAIQLAARTTPVTWVTVDAEEGTGRMTERPSRSEIPIAAQEQLIVELYSK